MTAADVARLAGCSQAAVSLWVTGKYEGRLTPEWQQRIAAAIEQLGYVPNRAARNLVNRSSRSVALMFPGASYSFFGPVLEGVTGALESSWEVTFHDLGSARRSAGQSSIVAQAVSADTAGVILASPAEADLLSAASSGYSSVVVVDAPHGFDGASLVSFDLADSIAALADDLAAAGHRVVAYVSFDAPSLTLVDRRLRLGEALAARRLRLIHDDVALSTTDPGAVARRLAERWPRWQQLGVTAVVCADDRHAYGVLQFARDAGYLVPEDLSLAAFNDSTPAAFLAPPLSSIALPAVELGEAAGNALLQRVADGEASSTSVPTSYRPRGSIGYRR